MNTNKPRPPTPIIKAKTPEERQLKLLRLMLKDELPKHFKAICGLLAINILSLWIIMVILLAQIIF